VGFHGFGAAGLDFLAALAKDNSTSFFDAHRSVYERDLLAPAKLFVTDLGARLREQISTGLQAVPRVGGSIFRIATDRRFAPQATPYKPHLDFAFWEGESGPRTDPSLIARITPDRILLGAGIYALTGARLARYREALHNPAALSALDEAIDGLLTGGAELSDPTRTRPPKGFDPTSPAARYAVRDRLHLTGHYPPAKGDHHAGAGHLVRRAAAAVRPSPCLADGPHRLNIDRTSSMSWAICPPNRPRGCSFDRK
jgi:uncharacterized protein (TIGR02453 family)